MTAADGLTRAAARFVAGLRFAHLPAETHAVMARGMMDCVAVMLLGFDEPVTDLLVRAEAIGQDGEAAVQWGRRRARADLAALVNATAAHALDYDDTGLDGHPSAVLTPTILALGEATGATGQDMLTAYAAGYEVWAELIARDQDRHHGKGFHPSAIFGPLAAAAACCVLLRLSEAQNAAALSLAASMAGGLVANFGTMTKPFQLGRAAQSGIAAARLAAAGLTAAPDALEHEAGFLAAFSPAGRVDRAAPAKFGRDWRLLSEGVNIKLYPVCYAAHRSIDSMLALRADAGLTPDKVRAITVRLGHHQAAMLRNALPQTALEAKFSIQFAMASALLAGRVGLSEVSDAFVRRPEMQALMQKVQVEADPRSDPEQPLFAPADQATVTLADGGVRAGPEIRFPMGHARNPVAPERLRAKFDDCIGNRLPAARRDRLFAALADPASLPSAAALYH